MRKIVTIAAVLAALATGAQAADTEAGQAKVRVNMRNGDRVTMTVNPDMTYQQIMEAATKRAGDDGLRSVSLVVPRAKRHKQQDSEDSGG